MKRLEGEVIDVVEALGGQEEATWLDRQNVDPHQFLGMEINPRAAAIAELVLWIGFLQWHFRTRTDKPPEPILHAFKNITVKNAVLEADANFANPRRPEWPPAEYIVGNPPFIGKGEQMRAALGQEYLNALWTAHRQMNESADFVMFWWDHAADLLTRKGTVLRRFGFVTTNSITQVFNRRVIERHTEAKKPISIIWAVPDHPWTKASPDAAAVRIAMTVAEAEAKMGTLHEVIRETALDTDAPLVDLDTQYGRVNSDLTIGADLTSVSKLKSNSGVSSNGMLLAGRGFVLKKSEVSHFSGLSDLNIIRPYVNGRDLLYGWSERHIIDCTDVELDRLRELHPKIYQQLSITVKVEREAVAARTSVRDAQEYARNWWRFAVFAQVPDRSW